MDVKILEVEKEVLKRIDMICRFACCKYSINNLIDFIKYILEMLKDFFRTILLTKMKLIKKKQ